MLARSLRPESVCLFCSNKKGSNEPPRASESGPRRGRSIEHLEGTEEGENPNEDLIWRRLGSYWTRIGKDIEISEFTLKFQELVQRGNGH